MNEGKEIQPLLVCLLPACNTTLILWMVSQSCVLPPQRGSGGFHNPHTENHHENSYILSLIIGSVPPKTITRCYIWMNPLLICAGSRMAPVTSSSTALNRAAEQIHSATTADTNVRSQLETPC